MRAIIIGASGGIGAALVRQLSQRGDVETVYATARQSAVASCGKVVPIQMDICEEATVERAARLIAGEGEVNLVIVASGILSDGDALQPEKTYRRQSIEAFERVFAVNTFGPAMVARHFLPLMPSTGRSVFAALSARVGSLSDNRLGGWHAYRASKAALNMLLKNYAIELARTRPNLIIAGLHPGTVDTDLSAPFQANVAPGKLFSPDQSAGYLLDVVDGLSPEDTGKVFDWAGKKIPA